MVILTSPDETPRFKSQVHRQWEMRHINFQYFLTISALEASREWFSSKREDLHTQSTIDIPLFSSQVSWIIV